MTFVWKKDGAIVEYGGCGGGGSCIEVSEMGSGW